MSSFVGSLVAGAFRLQHVLGRSAGRTIASIRRGEHAFVVIVAIVIGVLGAYGAILFGRTHRDELPVCDGSTTKRIMGVVTRNAVIAAYNQRVFQLDLSGGFSTLVAAVHGGRSVEVLGGLHLAEVELPPAMAGKTLAQTNLRRDFELEVVLIHSADIEDDSLEGRPAKVPTPEIELVAGDRLLVMGTPKSIERLREYRLEPR